MAMKVATFNGCKVYSLSSGRSFPQWLSEKKKRALSKDEDYRKRVEIVQDFEMTTASQCIKMTKDKEHIILTGTYPPLVRCYTVSDMSMKFQRGLTCEVVAFECLSDDYGKIVFLQADRTINFHAPYGTHYCLRVPKFGRDLAYEWSSCDLFVASSSDEIYRINLELGQFREPFKLGFNGCNKIGINPVHQLLACGGETAACEFWDPRHRKSVAKLKVSNLNDVEVTSLKFDTDGLTLAAGTSNGQCILYDIRSSKPLYVKDHQYGLPVVDIIFHNHSKHIISADKKVIKIWERNNDMNGKILTNIETPADINNVHVVEDNRGQSGLLMIAGEQSKVMTYFVPQLGPAPRWCSFLEGITEELEESTSNTVYEDFKFITQLEVEELGASGLIGTPMLKGYMHGYFIDVKLYSKLRAVSKPFEYEEHRKKRIREKMEEKRESRIIAQKRLPKINRELAAKLMKRGKSGLIEDDDLPVPEQSFSNTTTTKSKSFIDDRFSALFQREEFQQDMESLEFKLRNPSNGHNSTGFGKGSNGGYGSDDDLNDIYEEVAIKSTGKSTRDNNISEDDEDDNYDDNEDDDNGNELYSDGEEEEEEEEDSDLEPIRAEPDSSSKPMKSMKKPKNAKSQGSYKNEEVGGEILQSSKRALLSTQKQSSKSSIGQKPRDIRMFELSDGIKSTSATFGHTESARRDRVANKIIGDMPIAKRLAVQAATKSSSLSEAEKAAGLGVVKYVRGEDGLAKEMSYIPGSSRDRVKDKKPDDRFNSMGVKGGEEGGFRRPGGRSFGDNDAAGRGRGRGRSGGHSGGRGRGGGRGRSGGRGRGGGGGRGRR